MKEICVWKKKQNNILFLLSNCPQVQNCFMTDPLNIIFGRFLYMISMLYIRFQLSIYSKRSFFTLCTVWLWSRDEYVNFWFWVKVHHKVLIIALYILTILDIFCSHSYTMFLETRPFPWPLKSKTLTFDP